jgi:hypothetical protein
VTAEQIYACLPVHLGVTADELACRWCAQFGKGVEPEPRHIRAARHHLRRLEAEGRAQRAALEPGRFYWRRKG